MLVPGEDTHYKLKALYRIMTINATSVNGKIIFKLEIPLLLNGQFQLFKWITVPTIQMDSYIGVEPSTEFLMISLNQNYHYSLTETNGIQQMFTIRQQINYLHPQAMS